MLRKNEKKALCPIGDQQLASVNGALTKQWASGLFYALGGMTNDPGWRAFYNGAITGVNSLP